MKLIGFTLLLGVAAAEGEFYQGFRGRIFPRELFKITGPNASELIQPEAEGLRITLPPKEKTAAAVGIEADFPIKGDFEITVGYELLKADPPQAGFGVGLEIYLVTATTTKEAAALYRFVRRGGGEAYGCSRMTTNKEGRRVGIPGFEDIPTTAKSGQLRIKRTGTEAVMSAAEGADKDFRELYRFDLTDADIVQLRLAANPGNAPNAVDLRLMDLRVRAADVPRSAEPVQDAGASPSWPRRNLSVLAALLAAALVIFGLLVWRHKSRARREEPDASEL
jgi:hypothetical protein